MKTSELLKILKKNGCRLMRHGSGHDLWQNVNGKIFTVPRHKGEIPTGTAKEILKQAEIE